MGQILDHFNESHRSHIYLNENETVCGIFLEKEVIPSVEFYVVSRDMLRNRHHLLPLRSLNCWDCREQYINEHLDIP